MLDWVGRALSLHIKPPTRLELNVKLKNQVHSLSRFKNRLSKSLNPLG